MATGTADPDEILVIGGGIGGLAAALALSRTGRAVRVLERAAQFGEVGAGIQLAPNATRLLHRWELLDPLRQVANAPRQLVLADARTGADLCRLDLTGPFVERYGAPYLVAHRSDLLALLVDGCRAAGVRLEPDREVTGVHPDPDGVEVACAGGRGYRAALVIAADGLHSRIRAQIRADEPVGSGYVAYRGAIPIAQARRTADLDQVVAFIGPGMHFVQYALRGGRYYNQVAVFRSEAYRRGEADWGGPQELRAAFDQTCDHVRTAAGSLRLDQRWPMYDREPIGTWVLAGRVALLGDAAHPMLQYLAQGACQALEDAAVLADALARHTDSGPLTAAGLRMSLEDYQRQRVPHTARVQRNARTWGDIWHAGGLAAALRDDALAHRRPTDYRATDWLYGRTPRQWASSPAARYPAPDGAMETRPDALAAA